MTPSDPATRPAASWNCHCSRCRRITGHHMAAIAAHAGDVVLDADATLRWYAPAAGVRYGFCGTCGSTLFWRTDATPGSVSIAAGSLDQPTGLTTEKAWWVAEAADYHQRSTGVVEVSYGD